MDEKKRIKYIDTSKAVEIIDIESLEKSKNDIWDMIREAQELALKEGIKANSIVINKKFVKVPSVWVNIVGSPRQLPPMICGLECYVTDNELPDNYSFAVVEKLHTERERLIGKTESNTAREILTLIKNGVELNSMIDGDAKIAIMNELRWAGQKYGIDFTNS